MSGGAELSLVEHVRRLRHDLGKYVSLQVRWLGEAPSPDALRQALCEDLLRTRRGPAGARSAPEVWGDFRERLLRELPSDPHVQAIEADAQAIEALLPALVSGDASGAMVEEGARAAARISAATRALLQRVQAD